MSLYVDSSAFTKLYVDEPESSSAAELLRGEHWTTGRHTYVEVRRALHGTLDDSALRRARKSFEGNWRDTEVVELDETTCGLAAGLAEMTGVKTLDALHLAAAQRAGAPTAPFVTFDRRQAEAARSLGWAVAGA
jgi:predicted nucleic acid-binding protein